MQERTIKSWSGYLLLVVLLVILAAGVTAIVATSKAGIAAGRSVVWPVVGESLVVLGALVALFGFFTVQPNQARVLQLFGDYRGSVRETGLRWANPFFSKAAVSLRTRNFETTKLKVNDSYGNPIEIGAVVVWQVVDSARALFAVDDYQNFVQVQSEAALRSLASGYPYDAHREGETALVSHLAEISAELCQQVQVRLAEAGVQVMDTRISHLAYAQEIAAAMLQRQQASAVVAARQKIVEGAVGMVEHALEMLSARQVVELDPERRAAMVSNLLVVLCSDRHAQPVVNTGTLHH